MATLSVSIASSTDDQEILFNDGLVIDNGTTISGGQVGESNYGGAFRFVSSSFASLIGATINSAVLRLICGNTSPFSAVNMQLRFDNSDSPAILSDYTDYFNRTKTSAVAWNNIPTITLGDTQDSPDIKSILATILARPGFTNTMMLFLEDTGSDGNAIRTWASYDHASLNPPALVIDYTAAAGAGSSNIIVPSRKGLRIKKPKLDYGF